TQGWQLFLRHQRGGHVDGARNVALFKKRIRPHVNERDSFARIEQVLDFSGRQGERRRAAHERRTAQPADVSFHGDCGVKLLTGTLRSSMSTATFGIVKSVPTGRPFWTWAAT